MLSIIRRFQELPKKNSNFVKRDSIRDTKLIPLYIYFHFKRNLIKNISFFDGMTIPSDTRSVPGKNPIPHCDRRRRHGNGRCHSLLLFIRYKLNGSPPGRAGFGRCPEKLYIRIKK